MNGGSEPQNSESGPPVVQPANSNLAGYTSGAEASISGESEPHNLNLLNKNLKEEGNKNLHSAAPSPFKDQLEELVPGVISPTKAAWEKRSPEQYKLRKWAVQEFGGKVWYGMDDKARDWFINKATVGLSSEDMQIAKKRLQELVRAGPVSPEARVKAT